MAIERALIRLFGSDIANHILSYAHDRGDRRNDFVAYWNAMRHLGGLISRNPIDIDVWHYQYQKHRGGWTVSFHPWKSYLRMPSEARPGSVKAKYEGCMLEL